MLRDRLRCSPPAPSPALVLAVFVALASVSVWAHASDSASRIVAVTPDEVDQDFAFQGEYRGRVVGTFGPSTWGLQVVALGDGQFRAVQFDGGLPGAGAVLGRYTEFTGSREGNEVWLKAGSDQIRLAESRAEVLGASGTHRGTLEKIVRTSPTLGLAPPPNAITLFSGGQTQFADAKLSPDGYLLSGVTTPMAVQDFHLHLEFRTPYMPHARGQQRGNSGVYIQRRYEVQILDSFGLEGLANECGGLYKQRAPQLNMALPPLTWQTYDIYFTAARWDSAGRKIAPAYITVFHNGIGIHYRQPIVDKTGAGQPEGPEPLPIHLQDHGDPVTFRNVWIELLPSTSPVVTEVSTYRPRGLLRRAWWCP